MKWAETLYLSPELEKRRRQIGPAIRSMDFPPAARIFALHRKETGEPQLVIIPVAEIKSRRAEFAGDTYFGVGVAENRKAALEMAQKLTEEAVCRTGNPDAASYLAGRFGR
jgi:hypothetical protein